MRKGKFQVLHQSNLDNYKVESAINYNNVQMISNYIPVANEMTD